MAASLSRFLDKYAGALGTLAIIIGGVVWLTTLHGIAQNNQKSIARIESELEQSKGKIYSRLQNLDERLARMEGKIDMIIENRR